MNRLWLTFGLLAILAIFIPKLRAEEIAVCNESGCTISAEKLSQILHAVLYWHEQAQTCKGI